MNCAVPLARYARGAALASVVNAARLSAKINANKLKNPTVHRDMTFLLRLHGAYLVRGEQTNAGPGSCRTVHAKPDGLAPAPGRQRHLPQRDVGAPMGTTHAEVPRFPA